MLHVWCFITERRTIRMTVLRRCIFMKSSRDDDLTSYFSVSVNRAIRSLGSISVPVTSMQFVVAIADIHPEYGQHMLKDLAHTLDVARGTARRVDQWLMDLVRLYSVTDVESSSNVIHGRQVILGLAEIDPDLRAMLEPTGFLSALRGEVAAAQLPSEMMNGEVPLETPQPFPLTRRAMEWLRVGENLLGPRRQARLDGIVILCVALVWGLYRSESSRLCASVLDLLSTESRLVLPPGSKTQGTATPQQRREQYVEEVRRRTRLSSDPFSPPHTSNVPNTVDQKHAGELIDDARTISARITHDGRVHSRHLLASAVQSMLVRADGEVFRVFGMDERKLAHLVIGAINQRYPDETQEWQMLLSELLESLDLEETRGGHPREDLIVGEVPLLHDQPAQKDTLGRWILAKEIAALIDKLARDKDRPEAFALHLDAPWGAGKSTLVGFLEAQLRDTHRDNHFSDGKTQTPPWIVINMDAWRSSQLSPAWWALLSNLRRGVRSELDFWKRRQFDGRLFYRECTRLWRLWVPAAAIALVVVFLVLTGTNIDGWTASVASIIAFIALIGGLGSRFVSLGSLQGARLHERLNDNPMEEVAGQISAIRRRTPRPIMLVLDDLDRCNERFCVELLDAVQTLMRTPLEERQAGKVVASSKGSSNAAPLRDDPPALVVLAVGDHRWLRAAYEDAYAVFAPYVGEPGRPLGTLFLDKLFQVRVDMPALSRKQVATYIRGLIANDARDGDGTEQELPAALEALEGVKRRIRAASHDGVGSLDQRMADILYEDAAELPTNQRAEVVNEVLEVRRSDDISATSQRHMLETYGELLAPNPRAAKRFLMAYNLALAARLSEYSRVDPATLALWTVLSIRWPALADWLRDQLPHGPLPISEEEGHPSRLLLTSEVQAVISSEKGGPLNAEMMLRCMGLQKIREQGESERPASYGSDAGRESNS